jgi:formiminotetrahydrofolate cyclodeaminase
MATNRASLADATIGAVFRAAASDAPTPGGGYVSAVGGHLGVSLLVKALRISVRKDPSIKGLQSIGELLLSLSDRLLVLAEEDSESFDLYIQALRLPKQTEEEVSKRRSALLRATAAATEVSLNILDVGVEVLTCALDLRNKAVPSIMADVFAGTHFVRAMCLVARDNALANLSQADGLAALRVRLENSSNAFDNVSATFLEK